MAEFKLDRFKYRWRGNWSASNDYRRDDIVRVNGKSYVCLIAHTSSALFRTDLNATLPDSDPPQPQPKWVVMTSGRYFAGTWNESTVYNLGDLVLFQGSIYLCKTSHTSSVFSNELDNWEVFALHIDYLGNWAGTTDYGEGAIVKYGGNAYKCINAHTSQSLLEDNNSDWEIFNNGIEFKGNWTPDTAYKKNDLVKFGGSIFKIDETHTSASNWDNAKATLQFPGTQFDQEWSSIETYQVGDVVRYGGYLYYATNTNADSDPSRRQDDSTVDWIKVTETYNFRGEWLPDVRYKTGDIVLRGGYLYIARQDVNINDGDDSSILYLDSDVWEILVPGQAYGANWTAGTLYSLNDTVYYYGTLYICNQEHTADNRNFPGDNGNGFAYWDTLIQAGQPGGLLYVGDLLTYGLTREIVGDGSTLGDTRLGIGNIGNVLSVSEDLEIFWRNVRNDADTVYVSNNGDDVNNNGTKYSPFKTIRHACEYVEDTFDPLTLVKIYVSTGRFEEVGPIIVPAGAVVMGDELRSTSVIATNGFPEYTNDFSYVQSYLTFITSLLLNLVTNQPIADGYTGGVGQDRSKPVSNANGAQAIANLFDDFQDYIEFRVADGATDPTLTGSNTPNADPVIANAGEILVANKRFVANEVIGYLQETFPNYTFTADRIRLDIEKLFRGIARDIQNSGNYGTLQAARRYSNSTVGSQLDDLFYVRDTTGIRNMTTNGLQGGLNPPGVFDLYQRPTGGACVSLDPGWGPADERCWIVNRSPYIQGVTNIGTACVGQKIDGALHNGGNKSIVSNDFTQVLSDGVGAWVTNNARAELVSVFTYYCQVGYLAENGGIIRATNGNCSYGSWGAIADGEDPNETPQNVTVFNRNNEAQVESAFAGGANDNIFLFQYSNCGEQYTSASADIVGAGANAEVKFEDFRDGALFEGRLINTTGSGSEGGSNYLVRQSSAQNTSGASTRIILNTNEETQFLSEIENMRILIVSGDGSGQYGKIVGYDAATKVLDVENEITGSAGWNHIIPGTPIEGALDSTATYRIEPLVEVSHPGFNSVLYNWPVSSTIADVDFGGITNTYNNQTASLGTGETFDADPIAAVFDIVRKGSEYIVTLDNPGAGYAVGDTITFTGDTLGGATPANDLVLTVTSVTADSTNSILTFTQSGVGRAGRFVAAAQPDQTFYSDDGQTWTQVQGPFSGTFVKVLAGNGVFIAVPTGDNKVGYTQTGSSWVSRALPVTENWKDGVYGDKFVLIAEETNNAVYSTDGLTWSQTTLPTGDDSTGDQWQAIAYGANRYIAISGSQTKDVAYSADGISWSMFSNVLPAGDFDWVGLAYGDNRFLALASDGSTAYSIDRGATWYAGTTAPDGGTGAKLWKDIKYSQGVFFAIATEENGDATDHCATTEDGIYWLSRQLIASGKSSALAFASLDNTGTWVTLFDDTAVGGVTHNFTGKRAKARADVFAGSFQTIRIWDPGSGYTDANPPVFTVTDTQFVTEVEIDPRIGNGVLAQPSFINRGVGYRTSTATITLTGDGFADIIPEANIVTVAGVSEVPGPGVQIRFSTIPDPTTEDPDDKLLFNGVSITDLGDDGSGNGTKKVQFTVSPSLRNEYNLTHGTAATLQTKYSQCRISGHDFLDIGTGNFEETNYPELYAGGAFFTSAPENEVLETNGGRVFYTSTDQDGNFRAGELFAVDQATGIVTISAEFFDLDGLSELALGGVRLGGSGAVVNEFSTDPTFSADSNGVIPTQRAIATYLANAISVGGSDLETNDLQAGVVKIGTVDDRIETAGDGYLNIPRPIDFKTFDDNGNVCGLSGHIWAQLFFFRDNGDDFS